MSLLTENIWARKKEIGTISDQKYKLTGCFLKASIVTVTTDFTTHGRSDIYGIPCPSADSLDPMEIFYTFYVSMIIPKNMLKLWSVTFKPFLMYIHGFDP